MSWRSVLRSNFTSVSALADFLELPASAREQLCPRPSFRLNLPRRLAEKMAKGTLDHPLTRQFLPLQEEQMALQGWREDPVEDLRFQRTPRLLHKYEGRVLLVTTGACAMHCRYCFRQNYSYQAGGQMGAELSAIASDDSIREVILSGGDPLSLGDSTLERLFTGLDAIPHVRRIRFHTRFPIGIPERIDSSFLQLISQTRAQIWMVVHCNHPDELDPEVCASLKQVLKQGVPVLNQAVLLRGVNEDLDTQVTLCEKLVDHGIKPYYLHQLDRVQGAQRFEVEPDRGLKLIEQMRSRLSGYALPTFVQEVAGQPSKTPVDHLQTIASSS